MARFAAIGLDCRHLDDLAEGLPVAGTTCVGYDPVTSDPHRTQRAMPRADVVAICDLTLRLRVQA